MVSRASERSPEEPWFFAGSGVTNALARSVAWEQTPVGPWSTWSTCLKATLAMVFHARQPMFVWWGPELVQFYNDAYLPSFGRGKHPGAMGQHGRECWREIWPIVGVQIDDVMRRAAGCWNEDRLVPIERNGRLEEVYWTYSYGPVFDDDGSVGGTLVVCTETTARVVAERRMRMLRELADCTSLARDPVALMSRAAEAIAGFAADIPFAALCAEDSASGHLVLAGQAGVDVAADGARSLCAALLAEIRADPTPRLVPLVQSPALAGPLGDPGAGPWPEPTHEAWLAPLAGARPPTSVLLLGVSPRLGFDDAYRHFFAQILEHLGVTATRIEADRALLATQRERDNLLQQAPVGTALLTGPDHVYALANPIYCQIVGRSDIVGKRYLEAFPELTGTALPGILDRVYRTGESYVTDEVLIPLVPEGCDQLEDRYFKFNLEALREGGEIYGMMAVAVDVTAQVEARRTLERTSEEREKLLAALEVANRTKDEFLAMLGHELRNPLAPIVTALQLIKMQGGGTTSREHHIIERQVTHLGRLVDDLLDVSRITRGQIELRREPTEIADIFSKGIEMASHLLEKRGHSLTVDCPRESMLCDGDPVRLAQVIANLLTNAARYTDTGGHISLTAREQDQQIVIAVRDDGTGISAEMLPQVFDLFIQGKRGSDRFEGGLGIGLALVKSLVSLHGGAVTASSEGPGKGSEFVVRIPIAAQPERADEAKAGAPRPASGRVLVVDDNVDAAEILGDMLGVFGYEVALAHDGLAALEQVDRFRPDAAILDIGLPVIDGYELATRIRADPRNAGCRLIALSGYGQESDRRRSNEAGFECHLVKPVDIERIVAVLQQGDRAPA